MNLFQNMNLKDRYILFYRKVKHPRIEVKRDFVSVILPENYSGNLEGIIKNYENWINEKFRCLKELEAISKKLILYNQENLREMIQSYVEEFSEILRVKPDSIFFRKMKKRWGSCNSKKKRLIFNKDLKFLPSELIRYVVLHEMCHLVMRNHGREFWSLVGCLDSDYQEKERTLTSYRFKLDWSESIPLRRQ
jgi:predicted metal-dependent hydrolase